MRLSHGASSLLTGVLFMVASTAALADNYTRGATAVANGDFKTGVELLLPLANDGHPEAQFTVGLLYHKGLGVPPDERKAVAWYKKSAEGGYHKALEFMVVAYREGWFGIKKDAKQQAQWQKKLDQATR